MTRLVDLTPEKRAELRSIIRDGLEAAQLEEVALGLLDALDAKEAELAKLDAHRREGRMLLASMVKYAKEDGAETSGSTRLPRLASKVADYLNRTHEPRDILR